MLLKQQTRLLVAYDS